VACDAVGPVDRNCVEPAGSCDSTELVEVRPLAFKRTLACNETGRAGLRRNGPWILMGASALAGNLAS
jgi:hypothetical protein